MLPYLVVAQVAEHARSIFDPVLHVLLAHTRLLRKLAVVTPDCLVDGNDQVVNALGFGRNLAEGNSGSMK